VISYEAYREKKNQVQTRNINYMENGGRVKKRGGYQTLGKRDMKVKVNGGLRTRLRLVDKKNEG